MYGGSGLGLTELTEAAFSVLLSDLNAEIVSVGNRYLTSDQALAAARGLAYATVNLEPIQTNNFCLGHRPSLIEAPIENYPNISVMAYKSSAEPNSVDQIDQTIANLYVEVMVKGTELEGEELVNRRITRTTDAVVNVLNKNSTLSGTFLPLERPPTVNIENLFVRRKEKGKSEVFYWQGSRIDYFYSVSSDNFS